MHAYYSDILNQIDMKPVWWQEGGVPRFCPFNTESIPDIYADEAALVEIACQSCDTRFHVCFTSSATSRVEGAIRGNPKPSQADFDKQRLDSRIRAGELFYGDPPNIDCCAAGASMSSVPIRVIEYWERNKQEYVQDGVVVDIEKYRAWERDSSLEIELPGF